MLQSRDFRELLSILEKHEVRYLVIGGYAVMLASGRDQDLKDVESVQRKGETGSDG